MSQTLLHDSESKNQLKITTKKQQKHLSFHLKISNFTSSAVDRQMNSNRKVDVRHRIKDRKTYH